MSHILIVEDDSDIRGILSELLEIEGYRTRQARDGQEALELIEKLDSKPRLILLDLMMPVMDGYAFLEARAAHPEIQQIPVVVLTATPKFAPTSGVNAVLSKPIEMDPFLKLVSSFFELATS